MVKVFYVCSYGGSGSKMLCSALSKYGIVKHVHSRFPPDKLEYIGNEKGGNTYHEWFNGVAIPEKDLDNYYVIYIYRDPSLSIPSRFTSPQHLYHIQTDVSIKLKDVLLSGKDLYKITEFYNNYITTNKYINYKIYCIKYDEIFEKQDEISELFGIGKLHLVNKSKRDVDKKLQHIYARLLEIMNKNDFITIS